MAEISRTWSIFLGVALVGCGGVHSNLAVGHEALLRAENASVSEQADSADVAVRRERVLPVSAECAYDVVADVGSWSSWDSSIVESRLVEGRAGAVGALFLQRFEGFTARSRIVDAERGKMLRWRGQAPDGSGPVGVHTWTFVPQSGGRTLVLDDEHFHAWYLRPLGWVSDFGVGAQFDQTLADLEREALRRCGASDERRPRAAARLMSLRARRDGRARTRRARPRGRRSHRAPPRASSARSPRG